MTSNITQKNVEQFTKQAKDYAALMGAAPSDRRAALRNLVKPTADEDLLDIACGTGAATLNLAPFVRRAVGVDVTEAMLDQARAAAAKAGVDNIEWRIADVTRLPFEDGQFSIVTCQSAFHHFESGRAVLAEMTRVCRPGGRVAISDVTPAPEKAAAYDEIEIMRDPSHTHAFTLDELRGLAAGLPLAELAVLHNPTPPMPLDPILAASRPTEYSIAEIRALLEEDARSGGDHWGFSAKLTDGVLTAVYPTSIVVWTKT